MDNKVCLILRGFTYKENYLAGKQSHGNTTLDKTEGFYKPSTRWQKIGPFNLNFLEVINQYRHLIESLQQKYNLDTVVSTYDTTPKEILEEISESKLFKDIIISPEEDSYQWTTTIKAIEDLKEEYDWFIVLRNDLKNITDLFIQTVKECKYDPKYIYALIEMDHAGTDVVDVLQAIPKKRIGDYLEYINDIKCYTAGDMNKKISDVSTMAHKRKSCHNNENCKDFFTINGCACKECVEQMENKLFKEYQKSDKDMTYKCYGLNITPEKGLLSKMLISRLHRQVWEADEAKLINQYIKPEATVLDLGACLGITSCLTNKRLANRKKHVTLEPNIYLIKSLANIRDENKCEFEIENSLLSYQATDELIDFYTDPAHVMNGSLTKNHNRTMSQKVKQITIGQLEDKYNLNFDTLICDIEGGEWSLWEHKLLVNDYFLKFKTIIMEWHGKQYKKELYTKIMDGSLKANKYFMHRESDHIGISKSGLAGEVYIFQKD